ncbi:hypothetical protein [Bilophila wadsworthia]|uniref:hypothetical protein n=1 Tax=Bilophila wadsworthia TaxID=35833 RepID=UPI00399D2392
MSTTCVYSDIVLPAAHWYEYHDLSSTASMGTDPAFRTGSVRAIAQKFSELAGKHLGVRKDMVATALPMTPPAR